MTENAVRDFFHQMWPIVPPDGDLLFCADDRGLAGSFRAWRRVRLGPDEWGWASEVAERGQRDNVWYGVCLQAPGRGRGGIDTALWAPGLWAEVDYGKPNAPPTLEEAWRLVEAVGIDPSITVHSGHGLHAYWLFQQPLDLSKENNRKRLERALLGVACRIRESAEPYGWKIDKVADIARVLRPAGTLNMKGDDRPGVRLLSPDEGAGEGARYDADALIDWAGTFAVGETGSARERSSDDDRAFGDPASWDEIERECAWARHCREDAAVLPEPEWYAMLSISGRCHDGLELSQRLSQPHPGYSPDDTRVKTEQAVDAAGPRTCAGVESLVGSQWCSSCSWRGRIASPIVLGRRTGFGLQDSGLSVSPDGAPGQRRLTDRGLALRFIDEFGDMVRQVAGSWWAWDGRVWAGQGELRALRLAQRVADVLRTESNMAESAADRLAFAEAATSAEKAGRIHAFLGLAKADERIEARADDFDRHPWLLNCANGIVDLNTGELIEHRPGLMLTRYTPLHWGGTNVPPNERWDEFVHQVLPEDDERLAIQRLVGYTISGYIGERVVPFLYGNSSNGKSAFTETVLSGLGVGETGYARQAQAGFMSAENRGAIPADLAGMRGARMVMTPELETREELAVAFLKWTTGGGAMTARFMRENFFTFTPQFKVWVETNSRPRIKDTSNAAWGRILIIPFGQVFENNEGFKVRLRREVLGGDPPGSEGDRGAGFLRWCWDGYRAWAGIDGVHTPGLNPPSLWLEERLAMREDEDQFLQFINECCIITPEARIRTSDLYNVWQVWCATTGRPSWKQAAFNAAVRDAGYRYVRDARTNARERTWTGITLTDNAWRFVSASTQQSLPTDGQQGWS